MSLPSHSNPSYTPSFAEVGLAPGYDGERLPEYTDADAETLFGSVSPLPAGARVERLPVPLVLPQIASSYDSPFFRAYNPALQDSEITQDEWLRFIDGLNIAMTASPPIRVVALAGMVIGFVPYHWCVLAGAALQAGAATAGRVVSKTLTDRYLLRANKTFFEPRGLKVRLMKTAAVRRFVHAEALQAEKSKWKKFGESAGRTAHIVGTRLPVTGKVIAMFAKPAPRIDPNSPGDISYRRIQQFEGFVMPVSSDGVPPPRTPEGLLDKSSALALKLERWKASRSETQDMRNRQLLAIAEGRAPHGSMSQLSRMEQLELLHASFTSSRRPGLLQQVLPAVGGSSATSNSRLAEKVAKADRLEMLRTEGLVWLVLMNADEDQEIEGTELADTTSPEIIDNGVWQREVQEENEAEEREAVEFLTIP